MFGSQLYVEHLRPRSAPEASLSNTGNWKRCVQGVALPARGCPAGVEGGREGTCEGGAGRGRREGREEGVRHQELERFGGECRGESLRPHPPGYIVACQASLSNLNYEIRKPRREPLRTRPAGEGIQSS